MKGILKVAFVFASIFSSSISFASGYRCRSLTRPDLDGQTLISLEFTLNEAEHSGDLSIITTKGFTSFSGNELSYEVVDGARMLFLTGDHVSFAMQTDSPFEAVVSVLELGDKLYQNLPFICEEQR